MEKFVGCTFCAGSLPKIVLSLLNLAFYTKTCYQVYNTFLNYLYSLYSLNNLQIQKLLEGYFTSLNSKIHSSQVSLIINKIFFPQRDSSSDDESKEQDWRDNENADWMAEGYEEEYEVSDPGALEPRLRQNAERPRVMSEREVREIMNQYNQKINEHTRKIEGLKSKIGKINKQTIAAASKLTRQKDKYKTTKQHLKETFEEKERLKLQLENINTAISIEAKGRKIEKEDQKEVRNRIVQVLTTLLPEREDIEDLVSHIAHLSGTSHRLEYLKQENFELRSK